MNERGSQFGEKVRNFRNGLQGEQRKAFNALVGGAAAVYRPPRKGTPTADAESLARALAEFREGLPPQERDSFTTMVSAGGLAWTVAGRAAEDDTPTVVMFDPRIEGFIRLATAAAALVTAVGVLIDDIIEDDVEPVPIPPLDLPDPFGP